MTTTDYQLLKRCELRILRYRREDNNIHKVISDFSCPMEFREVLEETLKKIRTEVDEAEITEEKNEKLYFKISSSDKFFDDLFKKVF